MKGFIDFIREQSVIGLAVGFLLGGAVSKFVSSFVTDIVNPLLSPLLNVAGNVKDAYIPVGSAKLMWGNFLNATIDFVIIALVVYFGVKLIGLEKIDKKK